MFALKEKFNNLSNDKKLKYAASFFHVQNDLFEVKNELAVFSKYFNIFDFINYLRRNKKIDESELKENLEDYLEVIYNQRLDFYNFFKFIESISKRSSSSGNKDRLKCFFYIFYQEFPKYVKIQIDENIDRFLLFLNETTKILPLSSFDGSFNYNYDFCIKFKNSDFHCSLNLDSYFMIKENIEALTEITTDELQLNIINSIEEHLKNLNIQK